MDEIETRLKEASDNCLKSYEGWSGSKKNQELRSKLQESMHELRKITARLEIEMALSEREEGGHRQIPIPAHRSSRQRHDGLPDFIAASDDEGAGNVNESFGNSDRPQQAPRSQNNRQGGGGGGFQRRPMRRPHGGGGTSPNSEE